MLNVMMEMRFHEGGGPAGGGCVPWEDWFCTPRAHLRLRVRLTPSGTDAVSMVAVDENGAPVASVRTAVAARGLRALSSALGRIRETLFGVDWTAVATSSAPTDSSAEDGWLLGARDAALRRASVKLEMV